MGVLVVGQSSASPIKSIQRGEATVAGNITISAVDTSKTITNSFPTSASGAVQTGGTLTGSTGSTSTNYTSGQYLYSGGYSAGGGNAGVYAGTGSSLNFSVGAMNTNAGNITGNSQTFSSSTTDITVENYGVYLVDSTTITATGPCRYEVIEYY